MAGATRPDATQIAALLDPDLLAAVAEGDEVTAVGPRPVRPVAEAAHPPTGAAGTAKVAGGVGGGAIALYVLDALLKDPAGGGVAQVLAQLGPVLGPVYANAPLLLLLGFGLWVGLREYKRDHRAGVKRDKRLFAAFTRLAQEQARTTAAVGGVQQEVHGVRQDVQALRTDVDARFETVAATVGAAESRLSEHSEQIREVRERVDAHDEILRARSTPAAGRSTAAGRAPRGRKA